MKCRQRLFLFLLTWRFTGAAARSRVENRIWVDGGSGQLRERPLLSAADERAGQRNRPQAAACHLEFMGGGNAGCSFRFGFDAVVWRKRRVCR
jgi:hypothetical protein